MDPFLVAREPGITADPPSRARIAHDGEGLYLDVTCMEPDMEAVPAEVKERDGPVWNDDCLEIFLDPGRTQSDYFWLVVNSIGTRTEGKGTRVEEWDAEWEAAAERLEDRWTVRLYVPFSALGLEEAPKSGDRWGFDLSRRDIDAMPRRYSRWAHDDSANHAPANFGTIVFE